MARAEHTKHAAGASEIPWHAFHIRDAVAAVQSDRELGLTSEHARERRARVGPNALPETSSRSPVSVFVGQFRTPLIAGERRNDPAYDATVMGTHGRTGIDHGG